MDIGFSRENRGNIMAKGKTSEKMHLRMGKLAPAIRHLS